MLDETRYWATEGWPPALSALVVLMELFVALRISAVEFERLHAALPVHDPSAHPTAVAAVLGRIATAVDHFESVRWLRIEGWDLDADGLLEAMRTELDALRVVVLG